MKEAAGEANLTVVAVVLIGIVVAVATPIIKSLLDGVNQKACCTNAGYVWDGNKCYTDDTKSSTASGYWDTKNHKCVTASDGIN